MMNRKVISFLGLLLLSMPASSKSWWGEATPELEIEGGALLYHLTDLFQKKQRESNYFYKPMLLASKDGLIFGYLKNSHQKDSWAAGIRRYWFDKKVGELTYLAGYALGSVYGYCTNGGLRFYEDCNEKTRHQIAPYAQAFLKIRKGNVSLNLNYGAVIVYASVSAYFS